MTKQEQIDQIRHRITETTDAIELQDLHEMLAELTKPERKPTPPPTQLERGMMWTGVKL